MKTETIVLGIDPGSSDSGYAFLRIDPLPSLIAYGMIDSDRVFSWLIGLADEPNCPDVIAVEQPEAVYASRSDKASMFARARQLPPLARVVGRVQCGAEALDVPCYALTAQQIRKHLGILKVLARQRNIPPSFRRTPDAVVAGAVRMLVKGWPDEGTSTSHHRDAAAAALVGYRVWKNSQPRRGIAVGQ
jgi:hypothetical protein